LTVPNKRKKKIEPEAASQQEFREYAKRLGRRGGTKRSENLTPERRREIARKAAMARWAKGKKT
jgi:hypothetical protein